MLHKNSFNNNVNYIFKDHEILSKKVEKELFERYNNETDTELKEKIKRYIVEHNIKFVVKSAYSYRTKFSKVPMSDLISYGMLGLLRSIDKYEPSRDQKFITYCVWWIKQSIVSSVQDLESAVRYPLHFHVIIQKKIKANKTEYYDEEVTGALSTMTGGVSLNQTIYSDSDATLSDILKDDSLHSNPEANAQGKFLDEYLNNALDNLAGDEKRIIESCYGINRVKQNMETIGEDLDKSRETIRLQKKKALVKLKKNPIMKRFFNEYNP